MTEMFVSTPDGEWVSPQVKTYGLESHLQDLLLAAPHVIPGMEEPVAICKEFSTGAGPADLLVINAQGEITIIECKLKYNSESRREILGQILDYASSLWSMPLAVFTDQWQVRAGKPLKAMLGDKADAILENVGKYLEVGRFNLVLAVDEINPKLERIVTYLNRVTKDDISVYAVAFKRVSVGSIDVLMPTTFGLDQVEEKEVAAQGARHTWSQVDYRQYLATGHPSLLPTFDSMSAAIESAGGDIIGGHSLNVNALVRQVVAGVSLWPLAFYSFSDVPTMQINFHYLKSNPHREEFLEALTIEGGFELDMAGIKSSDFSRKPKVELASITERHIVALLGALQALNASDEVDE
jgi:hypothetical protein